MSLWLNGQHNSIRAGDINAELRALIKDEPPPPEFEPWEVGPTMSKHENLDAESVMTAVETASRLMGCKPDEVFAGIGRSGASVDYIAKVARARGYAAMALAELFDVPNARISRACGSSEESCKVHLGVWLKRIHDGTCPWFDQAHVEEIKAEILKGLSND